MTFIINKNKNPINKPILEKSNRNNLLSINFEMPYKDFNYAIHKFITAFFNKHQQKEHMSDHDRFVESYLDYFS